MNEQRPVFLELWRIKLPIMGIVSILHRVSGVLLILSIPYAVHLFDLSLSGPEGFAAAATVLRSDFARLVLLLLAWSLIHHLLAGLRYLMMDLGLALDRPAARVSAWTTISAALVATLLVGGGVLL